MLSLYIKSVIVYLLIYWAIKKVLKNIMINREEVNYKEYVGKRKGKGMYYTYCFIPIFRLLMMGTMFFIAFAKKETLDKLLKKDLEDK